MKEIYYRYESRFYVSLSDDDYQSVNNLFGTSCEVAFEEYEVFKKTAKGVWVQDKYGCGYKKFILNKAKKRFAYPTKKQALESFIKRKQSQLKHLERGLRDTNYALQIALSMKIEDDNSK
jgi:hypothetical protein